MKSKQKRITFTYFTFFILITLSIVLATGAGTFITGYSFHLPADRRDDAVSTDAKIVCSADEQCTTTKYCNYNLREPKADDQKVCLTAELGNEESCVWDGQCKSSYCQQGTHTCADSSIPRGETDECSSTAPCDPILFTCGSVTYGSLTYNVCQEKTSLLGPGFTPPASASSSISSTPPVSTSSSGGSGTAASSVSVQAGSPRCVELKADSFPGTTADPTFGTLWICRILPALLTTTSPTPVATPPPAATLPINLRTSSHMAPLTTATGANCATVLGSEGIVTTCLTSLSADQTTVSLTVNGQAVEAEPLIGTITNGIKFTPILLVPGSRTSPARANILFELPPAPTPLSTSATIPTPLTGTAVFRQTYYAGGCSLIQTGEKITQVCLFKISEDPDTVIIQAGSPEMISLKLNQPVIKQDIKITLESINAAKTVAQLAFQLP